MRQISYTDSSIRALRWMPTNTAMPIRSKIEPYAQDPSLQTNNVKSLRCREGIWLRVEDWQVVMDDQGNVVAVLDVGPWGGIQD